MPYRWLVFLLIVPSVSFSAFQSNDEIAIHLIALNKKRPIQQRIEIQSAFLLNREYLAGALGEGLVGRYDKNPLYRFDYFDCETYVDTVIALALAVDLADFRVKINRIRYDHTVDFSQRNHFPSADWIPNNRKKGYIRELTYVIAGQKTKIAIARINRRSWYQHLTLDRIQIPFSSLQEKGRLLSILKKVGECSDSVEKVGIAYIPVAVLLKDPSFSQKVPTGSLVFFVGHDPYLTRRIGTSMNVLHMGFFVWNKGQLYLRMASSRAGKVLDVRFQDYLKAYLPVGILQGVSVWAITPA